MSEKAYSTEEKALTGSWLGEFNSLAPPPFMVAGNLAVPIEVVGLEVVFEINVSQQRAAGKARLRFNIAQPGCPLFDLVPRPSRLVLNGQQFEPQKLRLVMPPDENTPLRMLDEPLDVGGEQVLEIEYPLTDTTAQFVSGGVRLGLFMTDLNQRGYLERHAPTNLEFNQFPMSVEIRLAGASDTHQLFTNGQATEDGGSAWRVTFPDYFTCSSFYVHLTNRSVSVRETLFDGSERQIPIKAYGEREQEVRQALENAVGFLRELEQTYGSYAHESLLIYCTGNISGGMEYAGATMTSIAALGHEITHSWFARGVMPANGNAGWIDEAIARWRDNGYPTASALPQRPPVNLAGFSPYRRHTPQISYAMGSLLLSELDKLFNSGGGLRPILARLFTEKRRQLITTPFFQTFIEQQTGVQLTDIFNRYVYGKDSGQGESSGADMLTPDLFREAGIEVSPTPAPRGFTQAELRSLL